MAGSYPDVPGYRFAYDQDGTVVVDHNFMTSTVTTLTSTNLNTLNNEDPTQQYGVAYVTNNTGTVAYLFPEQRSITGVLLNCLWVAHTVEWSNNTTNGADGTWTNVVGVTRQNTASHLNLRTGISTINVVNVTALRFNYSGGNINQRFIRNIHLYGSIATAESPDRLRIVDLGDDDIAAQLDFGNLAQRASSTRQFKVKNNSTTLDANNITVSLDAPTNASPSLIGQYQVSTDNVAFANAVNIGTLAPGAESGTMYVRLNPASNAQLGPWTARIIANAVSWS